MEIERPIQGRIKVVGLTLKQPFEVHGVRVGQGAQSLICGRLVRHIYNIAKMPQVQIRASNPKFGVKYEAQNCAHDCISLVA